MKPKPATNKRKRIILYYSLGLVLPGLILAYLAFRGLQNDQALREKQNRQDLHFLAQDFFAGLEARIWDYRDTLQSNPELSSDLVMISWEKLDDQIPVIQQNQMIYWPDGTLLNAPDEISDDLAKAHSLEFLQRKYSDAIRSYQDIIEQSFRSDLKLKAILGLARVYKKSGQPEQAVKTYETLLENHLRNQLSNQLPGTGLVLSELIRLRLEQNDSTSAQAAYDQLVRFFIQHPIPFEKSAFDFLLTSASSLMPNLETDSALAGLVNKTEFLHQLHKSSPALLTGDDRLIKFLESEDYPGLLVQSSGNQDSLSAWVLDLNQVVKEWFPLIFSRLGKSNQINWALKTSSSNGDFVLNENEIAAEFNFPPGYPPWKMVLSYEQLKGIKGLISGSQGVFIFVFAFILLLMIAGLAFMIHTLNQEMKLSKMKSDFISNVSHEFKTPLTSIRHMTEIMHLKRIESEERKEEYLQSMLEQCDHLGHLIENILDFSKIEENIKNYRFEYLKLDEVLTDLVQVFKSRIPEEDFEIRTIIEDQGVEVYLDKDAMQQVFYNLLDNAYKYSGDSRRIEVRLKAQGSGLKEGKGQRAEGKNQEEVSSYQGKSFQLPVSSFQKGQVVVQIKDWGLGISDKDQGRIFERFYRGDRLRKEGIKGSGIGLTIVKKIVEAHDGIISIESELGKGTKATIVLPVKDQKEHD